MTVPEYFAPDSPEMLWGRPGYFDQVHAAITQSGECPVPSPLEVVECGLFKVEVAARATDTPAAISLTEQHLAEQREQRGSTRVVVGTNLEQRHATILAPPEIPVGTSGIELADLFAVTRGLAVYEFALDDAGRPMPGKLLEYHTEPQRGSRRIMTMRQLGLATRAFVGLQ